MKEYKKILADVVEKEKNVDSGSDVSSSEEEEDEEEEEEEEIADKESVQEISDSDDGEKKM